MRFIFSAFILEPNSYNQLLQLENSKQYHIRDILKKLLQGLLTVTSEPLTETNSQGKLNLR